VVVVQEQFKEFYRKQQVRNPTFSYAGVSDINISLEQQTVVVKTTCSQEEILEKIRKTGKEVSFVSAQ
jgi:hypothetical protein